MLESTFKTQLCKDIKALLPGCIVLHIDPTEVQGMPDLLVLYGNTWAALEGKRSARSPYQPNQPYYVELMNNMSFSRFIYPENKEEVLYELQLALQPHRPARIPRRK